MNAHDGATRVTIRFDARMPRARWGPLFHVFRLEHPDVRLQWQPTPFPSPQRPLLDGADVGLFLEPPPTTGLSALTLAVSPMVVVVAAGHRVAHHVELKVADILDDPFPGSPSVHPGWTAFWTLDERRGRPPTFTDDDVTTTEDVLEVVAAGRAIATVAADVADGLAHPGVIALPLRDGPQVRTRLVWRADHDKPVIGSLIDLARAWTEKGREAPAEP
jgi:DNA-binding transcriptional LysR family regulator